jgi:RNA 2',3'-cyclic 3'-phosphodiesterase
MRVFISIDIPEEIRNRLAAVQAELRSTTTSARWVPAESAHLTLRFIGEVSDQRREDVDAALAGLTWKEFPVSVRGVGFFPGTRSPRVFWAGLQASPMEGLAQELDVRLERAGFDREKRAFRSHITLARAKTSRLERALVTAAEKFAETDFGSFVADRCFLYQSTPKPTGSVYTKLKEYML